MRPGTYVHFVTWVSGCIGECIVPVIEMPVILVIEDEELLQTFVADAPACIRGLLREM